MKNRITLALFIALALIADSAPAEIAPNVGFEELHIANGAEKPLTVGVWYPTSTPSAQQELGPFVIQRVALAAPVADRGLPLIVIYMVEEDHTRATTTPRLR